MHELAITQSILRIALEEAEKHGAERVLSIRLKIGLFSGLVPQLMQEYFNLVSAGSRAANARLMLDYLPAIIRCHSCGAESEVDRHSILCPHCNSGEIKLLQGREFYVESLEVE